MQPFANRTITKFLTALLITGMTLSGCLRTDSIKPSELPKLNGHLVQALGQVGNTRVIGVSVSTVEGVDGRTVQIKGEYNASVVTKDGSAMRFEHPVMSELLGAEKLSVKGSNRGEGVFDLNKIKYVDVETVDALKTTLVVSGASLALGVVFILALNAAIPKVAN